MDLSRNTSLAGLAEAVGAVQSAAESLGCAIYLTGALARDLWLTFKHEIDTGRRTEDVDFAVECADWVTFERLADELRVRGVERVARAQHKFRHSNGQEIDLIPYGGVEGPDRTLSWPPDGDTIMNLIGFAEVAAETTTVLLPGNVEVPVVRLHALALLKLLAWEDRRRQSVHKDAVDLCVIAKTYLKTRMPPVTLEQEIEFLRRNDFDNSIGGADLLGMDMALISSEELQQAVGAVLERETDSNGPLATGFLAGGA